MMGGALEPASPAVCGALSGFGFAVKRSAMFGGGTLTGDSRRFSGVLTSSPKCLFPFSSVQVKTWARLIWAKQNNALTHTQAHLL